MRLFELAVIKSEPESTAVGAARASRHADVVGYLTQRGFGTRGKLEQAEVIVSLLTNDCRLSANLVEITPGEVSRSLPPGLSIISRCLMCARNRRGQVVNDFLVTSIIASVVLTILLNVLPLLFPDAAAKVQRKIEQNARRAREQHEDASQPRVKVFFPWKAMLLVSVVLTVLVNVVGLLGR